MAHFLSIIILLLLLVVVAVVQLPRVVAATVSNYRQQ